MLTGGNQEKHSSMQMSISISISIAHGCYSCMLGTAHGSSSCMLGAAHGCSSCMLGATIIRRPHATWHAPPMSPPTTWLPLYNLKTQLIGVNQEKHVALFTCSCESGMCFESEWMVCICFLKCFKLCFWMFSYVYAAVSSSRTSTFLLCSSLCLGHANAVVPLL